MCSSIFSFMCGPPWCDPARSLPNGGTTSPAPVADRRRIGSYYVSSFSASLRLLIKLIFKLFVEVLLAFSSYILLLTWICRIWDVWEVGICCARCRGLACSVAAEVGVGIPGWSSSGRGTLWLFFFPLFTVSSCKQVLICGLNPCFYSFLSHQVSLN